MKDTEGNGPAFHKGERVYVHPSKEETTVIEQLLHYDMNESFWGNLKLLYDDGTTGISHNWQVSKL